MREQEAAAVTADFAAVTGSARRHSTSGRPILGAVRRQFGYGRPGYLPTLEGLKRGEDFPLYEYLEHDDDRTKREAGLCR